MESLPLVSIVIPCRNEEEFISHCLDSILGSNFPHERLDVIVVDGSSTDGTRGVLERYRGEYPIIRVLTNPRGVTPVAFNMGIQIARGDLVMIMSAHAMYAPDAIRKCVQYSQDTGADNVGGLWKIFPRDNSFLGRSVALSLSHPFGVGPAYYRITTGSQPIWVDTAAYGCYRKDVFQKIGLFNENLIRGQDMEFNLRLKKAGGKTLLVPDAVITYFARTEFFDFCRHNFNNGLWAILPFQFSRIIPVSPRHLVPMATFLVGTLLLLFLPRLFFYFLGFYLLLSFAIASVIAVRHRDVRYVFSMPLVFFTIHVSYGLGSAWGLKKVVLEPGIKRTMDIALSGIGLLVTFPIFLLLAIWIRRDSLGPVFYLGRRVGKNGKIFSMYKFRSMVANADKIGGPSTPDDDPRLTRSGKFIRRFKLDELAQLINVFKGEMSLVGPRPEVPEYVDMFTEEEKAILSVRPGITDWASMKFNNEGEILKGSLDPEKTYWEKIRPEKVRLQLEYVRNHSFWSDIIIIFQTINLLIGRKSLK